MMTNPLRKLNKKKATARFFEVADNETSVSRFDKLHGYVYGRWTYTYIGIGIAEKTWARRLRALVAPLVSLLNIFRTPDEKALTMADGYHGKVVPLDKAKQLIQIQEEIELRDLEHIIPYPIAKDIVIQNPDHIVVLDCPCRNARLDPCLPMDVCLIVGEPFASFVLSHHPQRSRQINSSEAEKLLEAEHARGHVHHAFFKDAMLGRFYAICNCCSCCCGAMNSHRNGSKMLASSGFLAELDQDSCLMCEECVEICPFGAIESTGMAIQIDASLCMGCGVCVGHCDAEALTLTRDESLPLPLDMQQLIQASLDQGVS
jgi:Pyruvate/2-oxoacid:ferredoxin oxidoreductase delta subunit